MDVKKLAKMLSKAAEKGIWQMCEHQECSHSINLINSEGRAITLLMVIAPARLDQPIYEALKPIIEADGKVGTLVQPNPNVPRS